MKRKPDWKYSVTVIWVPTNKRTMRTHTHIRFITAIWSKWGIPVDSRQLVGLLYMNAFVNLSDNVFGIRLLYFKLVFQLHHKSLDRGIFLHCFGVSHGQTNLQENCTVKCTTINWRFVKANFGYRLIWSKKVKDFSNCDRLNLLPNPLPNIFCNYWTTYLIRPLPEIKNCWTQRTSLAKPHIIIFEK